MKKFFAIALALLLILGISAALAEESEPTVYTSGDYQYILLPDGTAEITDYTGKDTVLSIPAQLDGYTVTSIGDRAFIFCGGLTEITLPEGLTSIGDEAFFACGSLTEITLPVGLKSIGESAFSYCEGLKEITLPAGLTSIGDRAFQFCAGLTEITFPEGLTSIGAAAFAYCNGLTEITLPEGLTSIGNYAFDLCGSLTEITIPDSVTEMGGNPFSDYGKLTQIKVSPDHAVFASIDGVLFHKQEKKLICYPRGKPGETYAVPQGIAAIGNDAFSYCESLTEITLPEGLTSIGEDAFFYCKGLTAITLPETLAEIGKDAFNGCPEDALFTVVRGSYAARWCKENGKSYTYTDANDRLLN